MWKSKRSSRSEDVVRLPAPRQCDVTYIGFSYIPIKMASLSQVMTSDDRQANSASTDSILLVTTSGRCLIASKKKTQISRGLEVILLKTFCKDINGFNTTRQKAISRSTQYSQAKAFTRSLRLLKYCKPIFQRKRAFQSSSVASGFQASYPSSP